MFDSQAHSKVLCRLGQLRQKLSSYLLSDLAARAGPVFVDEANFVNLLFQLFAHLLCDEATGRDQADLTQLNSKRFE